MLIFKLLTRAFACPQFQHALRKIATCYIDPSVLDAKMNQASILLIVLCKKKFQTVHLVLQNLKPFLFLHLENLFVSISVCNNQLLKECAEIRLHAFSL